MAGPWSDVTLVGDGLMVLCADRSEPPYLSFDAAASTPSLVPVADRVAQFLPWYSSVHRGAGYKSQAATVAYEQAREAVIRFAGRADGDTAIICRNTTEAINHLAYRLRLEASDVVLTTVVEHHANLLPWGRATRRYVECGRDGTFAVTTWSPGSTSAPPQLVAITGASNVTGWLPPLEEIIAAAHERGVPVVVDAAQLAPHRPLPAAADFVAWSGHKMYAPFGAGVLVGPTAAFAEGGSIPGRRRRRRPGRPRRGRGPTRRSGRRPARPTSSVPSHWLLRSLISSGWVGWPSWDTSEI